MSKDAKARLYSHSPDTARAWKREERRHKLGVGDVVTLLSYAGDTHSKEKNRESAAARFQIARLLPVEGDSFQYRIKDMTTARERVVAEEQIAPFQP